VPVWHETTRRLREEGKIEVVGVIQEQHPERCRLFMQWRQMEWPVLVDPLNLLEMSIVPLALLIDERGIVREVLRDPRKVEEKLTGSHAELGPLKSKQATLAESHTSTLRRATELLLLANQPRFDEAFHLLDDALRENPEDGALHFARGVAHRLRYDSPKRASGDFAKAVESWQRALDLNPNQYIWRRRIQQYGPRLDKPYPFYDWVEEARREIRARGETPVELVVELAGAELAGPERAFPAEETKAGEPDPKGRFARDMKPLVICEVTVVPPRISPRQAARVHIVLRPNPQAGGHWNNEEDPLVVWVDPPSGWIVNERRLTAPRASKPVSDEPRHVEFELYAPADAEAGTVRVTCYALYGVCEGPSGTCLHRRADVTVGIEVTQTR
jgi:hypothetical protein